ncbi:hypothetical protein C9381_03155 [Pantoea vagans]|uniref:Uncharacterized protein n=1 Tax=Pantoea vagans TaxID=470934 RepID=A0AAN1NND1_9GAMM|nr:hypothetical protein C9381_03155 [Pantoea vagans]
MQYGLAIPGSDALLLSCAPLPSRFIIALTRAAPGQPCGGRFTSQPAIPSFMLALSHAFNSDEAVAPHGLARQKSEASGPGMARPIDREVRFLRDRTPQPGRRHPFNSHFSKPVYGLWQRTPFTL